MSRVVIVAYKPKPGRHGALEAAVKKHLSILASEDLVTTRDALVLRASDGTLIEIFEWRSSEGIASAHSNPKVQALWAEFGEACDYVPLATLAEGQQMFAEFEPIEL